MTVVLVNLCYLKFLTIRPSKTTTKVGPYRRQYQPQDWNPPSLYNSNFYLIRAHPGGPILAANFSPAGPYLVGDQISRDRTPRSQLRPNC